MITPAVKSLLIMGFRKDYNLLKEKKKIKGIEKTLCAVFRGRKSLILKITGKFVKKNDAP